jgi:heme/copper-type cytochrome/quinol oxidase subunit 2
MLCPHCRTAFEPSRKDLDLSADKAESLAIQRTYRVLFLGIAAVIISIVVGITYCHVAYYATNPGDAEDTARRKWQMELDVFRAYIREVQHRLDGQS